MSMLPTNLMDGHPEEGSAATVGHFQSGRQPRDKPPRCCLHSALSEAVSAGGFPIGQMQLRACGEGPLMGLFAALKSDPADEKRKEIPHVARSTVSSKPLEIFLNLEPR